MRRTSLFRSLILLSTPTLCAVEGAGTSVPFDTRPTCAELGTQAIHLIAQEEPQELQASPVGQQTSPPGQTSELYAGSVTKLTRHIPEGVTGKDKFYLAIVSNLNQDQGVWAWRIEGALTGDFVLTAATTEGTVAGLDSLGAPGIRPDYAPENTRILKFHAQTGAEVDGFRSTVGLDAVSLFTGMPPGSLLNGLDPVGTATVLELQFQAGHPIALGEVQKGKLEWVGLTPVDDNPDANEDPPDGFFLPDIFEDFCSYPALEIEFVGVLNVQPAEPPPAMEVAKLRLAQPAMPLPGDLNFDLALDISDALGLLGYLFLGRPERLPCGDGTAADPANLALLDSNGDGGIDLSDVAYVLSFLFHGSRPPVLGRKPVAIEGCAGTR